MDVVDHNIGGTSAIDKLEHPTSILVNHLSTLSDRLDVMSAMTDKIDFLAEVSVAFERHQL